MRLPAARVRACVACAPTPARSLGADAGMLGWEGERCRLFRQYDVGPDIRSFGISLTSLLECLQFLAQADPGRGPGVIELRMASLEDGLQMLCVHARDEKPSLAAHANGRAQHSADRAG